MRIGFVGGGTGGHFYPLIAVAEKLTTHQYKPEMYYFGPSPYDKELLTKYGITFVSCPAGKLRNYFSIQNFFDIFRNFFGFLSLFGNFMLFIPMSSLVREATPVSRFCWLRVFYVFQ